MEISRSMECHRYLPKICEWVITHKNHLPAAYIPGKLNTVPDKKSRSNRVHTKWMPQPKVFESGIRTYAFQTSNIFICYQY